ncbi:hypothetical protein FP744_10005333 [Trichoderma asperellum]
MSDFNHDRDGVISLFNLPSNLPASQNFRRDTRRGRSWAVDFHNSKVFIAAASSLATSLLFFTIRYFFATPDTLLVPVPANRGASHKGSSRAMTMSVNEIRGDKKTVLDERLQISDKVSRHWAKLKRRLNRHRRGSQADENLGDEELAIRNVDDASDRRGTKAAAPPTGQSPGPQSNAAPSSADLTLTETREGLGPEARYLIDHALLQQKDALAKSIQQSIQQNEQQAQQQAQIQRHSEDASSAGNGVPPTPPNSQTPPPASINNGEETA